MNIPLDRLYHYIDRLAKKIYGSDILIYRFWPHGSKNLKDLSILQEYAYTEWETQKIIPELFCNDQEPLFYDFYEQQVKQLPPTKFEIARQSITGIKSRLHPNFRLNPNANNLALLLHSEKRSSQLKKYQDNDFIPVYYWSHAVIASDWFRFAEHVDPKKDPKQIFLIYNRAWSGTREYRLRFAELLIQSNIQHHCKTTLNAIEPELNIHYNSYNFNNPVWRPSNKLENYFTDTPAHSNISADFVIEDYEHTDIEIVLETLFDDDRLHLTEKSLRPIAVGQPFVLVSTSGSLEYLKSYGFRTFDQIWDESYDTITDPQQRLKSIVDVMKSIAEWTPDIKAKKLAQAQLIAEYNKKHFFSREFFNQVIEELTQNFSLAFEIFDQCNSYSRYLDRWNQLLQYKEMQEFLKNENDRSNPGFDYINFTIDRLNKLKSKKP